MDASPCEDSMELWDLCWEVNAGFAVKFTPEDSAQCIKCRAALPKNMKWRSNLPSTSILSACEHSRKGFLCGSCDDKFLLSVTKAEQTCFQPDCEEMLTINEESLRSRLSSDVDLVERYFRALSVNTIECNVCSDFRPRPKRSMTATCSHNTTCLDCIKQIIEFALDEKDPDKIKCTQCGIVLEGSDVRDFVSTDMYKKYGEIQFMCTLNKMENFRWCLAPGCGWGQLHSERSTFPKVCCTRCGFEGCYDHQIAWHKGQTCSEFSAGEVRDAPSQEYFNKFCKRCPSQGCGIPIEKNGACPDMTCRSCRKHFCWECKVLQHAGSYAHVSGCSVCPSASLESPLPESGPYRVGWNMDAGYIGHPGEYSGSYRNIRNVTVDERPS